MLFVIFSSFFFVGIMVLAVMCVKRKQEGAAIIFSVCSVIISLIFIFVGAPEELGYGKIPDEGEKFSKRLNKGEAYEVLSSYVIQDKEEFIVLVKSEQASAYYAIRVNAMPPKRFTLVDGWPIAIADTKTSTTPSMPPINKPRGIGLW